MQPKITPTLQRYQRVDRGLRFEHIFPLIKLYRMTIENIGIDVTSTERGKSTLINTERMCNAVPEFAELIVARMLEVLSML
jgi:hypothetical protein